MPLGPITIHAMETCSVKCKFECSSTDSAITVNSFAAYYAVQDGSNF